MLVPNKITNDNSRGEKLVFNHFKNDINAKDFIILHSLFVSKHLTRISGELDFLVLAPGLGIFALEVKHGKVSRNAGTWKFENRHGKITTSTIGPFRQVNDTMHSLRNYLKELAKDVPRLKERIGDFLFGCGVMFTSLNEFNDYGPEAETWQIFTRTGFRAPSSHFIHALSKGFHKKVERKSWYDPTMSRPSKKDCELIYKLLRGDFSYDYSNINSILDEEKVINHFTEEQFSILSILEFNNRCLIQGGAGTGKTLMATEIFMRNHKDGKKVGFFCYNKNLGNKLYKDITSTLDITQSKSEIGSFHGYMMSICKMTPPSIDVSQFFEVDLPFQCLIELEEVDENDKFDLIIIDESQDLMSELYVEVFDAMIKGGISNGNWVMFGDFCNQLIYRSNPAEIIDQVASKSAFTKIPPLKVNCRNTKNIVLFNHNSTGCELQISPEGMMTGERVEHFFPRKNKVEEKVDEIISSLISKGIPLYKITVLSKKRIDNSQVLVSDKALKWKEQGLLHTTVHSYKGLENSFIVLAEFDELDTDYSTSLLYIGISRARLKLYVVFDKDVEESYNKLLDKRFKEMMS
ncbi:nuclease-related domain-containing DEAD/DEAH box helicase [[Muricauda] lutisoli]|uniref:DNA 3'-5' helicase II n=1 Tax=[Muricauda] lutisoli TaxID=2816035 RepID=A0ABS3EU18_9FLAO|nr:NERD domain-containing protein [[Muricauda] lutisoli]MBO0329746.1 NERD domain-containing protein [[Muricauda] lutisoli]